MNTIETDPSNNARVSGGWSRSWTHFRVDRRSPRYCHVTFDHPPINTHDRADDRRRAQRPRRFSSASHRRDWCSRRLPRTHRAPAGEDHGLI